jgi:hypothetical protein
VLGTVDGVDQNLDLFAQTALFFIYYGVHGGPSIAIFLASTIFSLMGILSPERDDFIDLKLPLK